ncbi:MAG: DUF421 domain-containing protein [Anaerovoracaceae bacterium]
MIVIAIRTCILYLAALFVIRVMGKGELSKMDPFQLVVLFMIAELAALPIESTSISVLTGLTALITLLCLQVFFSIITLKSPRLRNIISGKASVLIEKGRLNEKELKALRISIDDLSQQLRIKNFPSPADIDYAVMEANGDLSVIPKPENAPLSPKDLGMVMGEETIPIVLVADGFLYDSNLSKLGWKEEYFREELSKRGFPNIKEIFLCFADKKKELKIYPMASSNHAQKNKEPKEWDIQ